MQILLIPCEECNIKILNAIDPQNLDKKYLKYLIEPNEFEKMFNEGNLNLDRSYIKFIQL